MNFISNIVIILCFNLVKAQPRISCTKNDDYFLDTCFLRMSVFGSRDRKYPTNHNEMQTFCDEQFLLQKWVKDYANKCLTSLSRQVTNLFTYTNAKVFTDTCKSSKRTQEFLSVGICGNRAKRDTVKCFAGLTSAADGIQHYSDLKMKIPLLCCNYNIVKSCNTRAYNKYQNQCTQQVIDALETIMDKQMLDTLNYLCGDYNEDSDKCDQIKRLMPKSNSRVAPRSPVKPIINILSSFPDK